MPLVPTGDVVTEARRAGRGVGAFNVITVEHAEAIVTGAEAAGRPVILQISENAVRFHSGQLGPLAAVTASVARAATVDVALHLDHVVSASLFSEGARRAGRRSTHTLPDPEQSRTRHGPMWTRPASTRSPSPSAPRTR